MTADETGTGTDDERNDDETRTEDETRRDEEPRPDDETNGGGEGEAEGYSGVAILVSAIVGVVVALVAAWAASNLWGAGGVVLWEQLFRIAPTVEGGGVGTDWVLGNTIPALDFLIALTHAADVIMGVFILLMVFVHWASFRRLADQMQPARADEYRGDEYREDVATDGGEPNEVRRSSSDRRSDGGNESVPRRSPTPEGGDRG